MKRLYVGGLPEDATEDSVTALFAEYGKVRSVEIAKDIFSGRCRGFGFVDMEGHEGRAAMAGLNGKLLGDKPLKVRPEEPRKKRRGGRR